MTKIGMIVCGTVTGTHILQDINVAVPHRVAVPITARQMVDSKDLYRALNSGAIFKLDGGHFHNPGPVRTNNSAELATLRQENKELKRQLAESQLKNDGLQRALMGLNTQLDGILGAIGRLEGNGVPAPAPQALPPNVVTLLQQLLTQGGVSGAAVAMSQPESEVVGGEAPVFLPTTVKPEGVETSIRVEKAEGSSVTDASKRLKELRKAQG